MRKSIKLGLILLLATQAFARNEYTRNFDKTVTLAAGQSVRLEHRMGNVEPACP